MYVNSDRCVRVRFPVLDDYFFRCRASVARVPFSSGMSVNYFVVSLRVRLCD